MFIKIYSKDGNKYWLCDIEGSRMNNNERLEFTFLGFFQDESVEVYIDIEKLIFDEEPIIKMIRIKGGDHAFPITRFVQIDENSNITLVNYIGIKDWKLIERNSEDAYSEGRKTLYQSIQFEICDTKGRTRLDKDILKIESIKDVALYPKTIQTYKLLERLSNFDSFKDYEKKVGPKIGNKININDTIISSSALEKLYSLIGLNSVKEEINSLIAFVKIRKMKIERNLMVTPSTLHMVFTGNPGTGKTTVARIIGELYFELGLISKGHCVEVSRTELVGEYVGHTAPMVTKKFNEAIGGVLFIDEAYQLNEGGDKDFGKEAISTLLKLMEDHREKLVVIVAGYPADMKKFIDSNPGLDSRFATKIHFEDFSGEEFFDCLMLLCKEKNYMLTKGAEEKARLYFEKCAIPKAEKFGNGRGIRNLFEKIERQQANRLSKIGIPTDEELLKIEDVDIPANCL